MTARSRDDSVPSGRSADYGKQPKLLPVPIPGRSVNAVVVAFPLLLGVAVSAVLWVSGQVLVLAILLGWGDLGADSSGRGLALAYVLATALVGGAALGPGAAVCARLLILRDVAARAARWVALAQSAVLIALGAAHGLVTADPSPTAVGLFLLGAVAGALGGAVVGAPGQRGGRGSPQGGSGEGETAPAKGKGPVRALA